MMLKVLGLDLGVSSIGWAVINDDRMTGNIELIDWGSRIFEQGMDGDIPSGKGESRCAQRRLKRSLRVQYGRRRKRKEDLVALLKEGGYLPEDFSYDFILDIDKRLLKQFPENQRVRLAHLIPYMYRKRALDFPLERFEFGRVIYHLAQRRGYLSNRKSEMKQGNDTGIVKDGIKALKEDFEKKGARTLGEYFCSLNPETEHVRRRYTERSMFQDEFRKICQAQRNIISEEFEKKLYNVLFYQRPLKSCKGLIGACSLYPEEKRCSFMKEDAQLFRMYSNVNNLRISNKDGKIRELSAEERTACIGILNGYSSKLTSRGTIKLEKLGKEIGLPKGEKFTLSDDEKDIYGNVLHAQLYHVFGDAAASLSEEKRELFFQDLNSIEKTDALERRLKNYWKLDSLQIENAEKLAIPYDEYCAYSEKALKEIVPGLEIGLPLAKVLKDTKGERRIGLAHDTLPLIDKIGIDLRNPVVHRVMTELRIVVNAIIARYGKPDEIHIELARDLKSTNKERERYTQKIRQKEKEKQQIAMQILEETSIKNPSHNDILKVMLANECNWECPYTGKHFSMGELLHGSSIQIEHIIPYSRSYDDSFGNKTLCETSMNVRKGNRTPFEAFSGEEYELMLRRVERFNGPFATSKLNLFKQKEINEEDFLQRNLNDTRYASKLAMKYLGMLYGGIVDSTTRKRIHAMAGGCTALVRRAWGGNYLLGEGEKVRCDHRHHAIDALTIAMITDGMVKQIADYSADYKRECREKKMPLLDNQLYRQALEKLDAATVSHHLVNKIRGELHKETIYTKSYGGDIRHGRVNLDALSNESNPIEIIRKIVDPAIRKAVCDKLGVTEETLDTLDKKVFKCFTADPTTLPVLKDRNGNPVNTIKHVRVLRKLATVTIGQGDGKREVANSGNYVLAIFAKCDSSGKEIGWEGKIVTLMEAKQRLQRHQPLFEKNLPGLKFKFSLKKGDIVTIEKDGQELLCIIRGISLPQFYCTLVNDARMKKDLIAAKIWYTPTVSAAFNWHMTKWTRTIFGEMRRAND